MSYTSRDISIVMPIYNAGGTLIRSLRSLYLQKGYFHELIIIDDNSTDDSVSRIKRFLSEKNLNYRIIYHDKNLGLSNSYNDGIKAASGKIIITMHQDVILKPRAVSLLISPFNEKKGVVATFHKVIHPLHVWKRYNFWQKCLFARLVGKTFSGLDGKFDAFRKSTLLKIGLFDAVTYKRAGEDGDIYYRLSQEGIIVPTEATIIHLHSVNPNFSWKDYIYKHKQYAEAQGVLLRHGRIRNMNSFLRAFFRETLLATILFSVFLSFLAPLFGIWLWLLFIICLLFYSLTYTKNVYLAEFKMSFPPFLWRINKLLNFRIPFYISLKYFISRSLIIAYKK